MRAHKTFITFAVAFSALIASAVADADVSLEDCFRPEPGCARLGVFGEIKSADVQETSEIIQLIRAMRRSMRKDQAASIQVLLDSQGGNVTAAIEIGRLLRKARATAIVTAPSQCLSACVFVLAGAVARYPAGPVGIHRPYSTETSARTFDQVQQQYSANERAAKQFLADMNLPPSLFEAMVRVPPEKVSVLSVEEVKTFGLLGLDPVEQEIRDAAEARRLGLTKRELLKRKARVEEECDSLLSGPGNAYSNCRDKVMRGGVR